MRKYKIVTLLTVMTVFERCATRERVPCSGRFLFFTFSTIMVN